MNRIGVQHGGGWFDTKNPEASFALMKKCGFNAVDFNIDVYLPTATLSKSDATPASFFDKDIEEILEFFRPFKEGAEKNGIAFTQMHAPFPCWYEGKDELNEHIIMSIEKCFAVCEYFGCPAIVVHPLALADKEKQVEVNFELYRRLMPAAKKYKVTICLENLYRNVNGVAYEGVCSSAEEACWYIDKLNEEAGEEIFGFCFDIGHALMMRRNVKEYVVKLGKRLTVLHLHDNDASRDCHMIPYSYMGNATGLVCDWDGFLEGLKEIGYTGAIAFETFRATRLMPKELVPDALTYIAAIGRCWANRIAPDENTEN